MYDVAIIGGGVIGCAAAYYLSGYNVRVAVVEKENDVGDVTTKANSGIVHAGYDVGSGTTMSRMNLRGSEMMEGLCKKLSVGYRRTGSLVLAFNDEDLKTLERLYSNAQTHGLHGVVLLNKVQALGLEPALSSEMVGALYAPTAAIVDPWDLCIALADTAKLNGVDFLLGHEVTGITRENGGYILHTGEGDVRARYVVNASGTHADTIHNMVSAPAFEIIPNKGEYYLMDKAQGGLVNTVIFQCPTALGKGVLIAPTVHGNLIVGPNSVDIPDPDDVSNTSEGLAYVKELAAKSVPGIDFRGSIRNFAGVRAQSNIYDFVIGEAPDAKGFIDLACIRSPGLSSAPAIGEECVAILKKSGLALEPKKDRIETRQKVRVKEMTVEEKTELIKKNPLYGRVICRCETVTEGELVDALRSPITPRTLDAVKKRCNAGLGRCQGGFCGPRVQEIISRELGIPMEQVQLAKEGSYIITGQTKGGVNND